MPIYARCQVIKCTDKPDLTTGCNTPESVGEVFQAGNEDAFLIQGVDHEIARACDPQSGQPTSSALHSSFKIVKMVDKASAMLFECLLEPYKIEELAVTWTRNSSSGLEDYFKTTLYDCYVASVRTLKKNTLDVSNSQVDFDVPDMEEVTFTYKQIFWEHLKSGVDYDWDWNNPPYKG